jgi:hypothetical protein
MLPSGSRGSDQLYDYYVGDPNLYSVYAICIFFSSLAYQNLILSKLGHESRREPLE